MIPAVYFYTGRALITGISSIVPAIHGFAKDLRHRSFSHTFRAVKKIGVGNTIPRRCGLKDANLFFMAINIFERHRDELAPYLASGKGAITRSGIRGSERLLCVSSSGVGNKLPPLVLPYNTDLRFATGNFQGTPWVIQM
jgi:hypothetical protein